MLAIPNRSFLLPALLGLLLLALLPAAAAQPTAPAGNGALTLTPLGTYASGAFDESAAEIPAYDPGTRQVFVTNAFLNRIDVIDISDPANPTLADTLDLGQSGETINSVAIHDGMVAVAAAAAVPQDPGRVYFYTTAGTFVDSVVVGALPDMVTFSPDGSKVVTANEGEPNDAYDVDPNGSVSIIEMNGGPTPSPASGPTGGSYTVTTLDFTPFNGATLDPTLRIFGPGATVAQDLEPEYVAISPDSTTAFVTLQENNGVAVVDLVNKSIVAVAGLGVKDYNAAGSGIDASDRDGGINIANWPVYGMYQPDAIAAYESGGAVYLVTVNEGDARDYDGFGEEDRIKDLTLDPTAFPNAATLQQDEQIGRLEVTTANGDAEGDGDYDVLWSFGARSFSIWDSSAALVYDSGDDLEQITAAAHPADFNSTNDENGSFDSRSDAKGPEPEALTLGQIAGRTYAFIGLERIGGIAVFDITTPNAPVFVTYDNNRDFSGDAAAGTAGDLGPEGLVFITPGDSPNGEFLLVVANEVSGTTTIYQIDPTAPTDVSLTGFAAQRTVQIGIWLLLAVLTLAAAGLLLRRRTA